MKPSIGVAVIGAGMAGRAHAQGYRSAQSVYSLAPYDVRLVAVTDLDEALATDAARRYGYERAETAWQAIAEAPDIEAVSVVVANPVHREVVTGLLEAGKHVLCEKPLAPDTADAAAMVAAADRASSIARVGYTFRFTPGVRAIAELVQSGSLGKPLHFAGQYWTDYGCDPLAPLTWRYKGGLGSGVLADIGSHIVDAGEFVCGSVLSVGGANLSTHVTRRPLPLGRVTGHDHGAVSGETGAVENEDDANYSVRFAGGATGSIGISRMAYGHPNTLHFEVFCERGAAVYDARTPAEILLADERSAGADNGFRRVLLGPSHALVGQGLPFDGAGIGFGHNDAFVFQARSFLDEIAGIRELPGCPSLAHGLHNLEIQEAVVDAAATGARINLDAEAVLS
ncbi:Gfo/Idh/MocA family protein [Solirubrobacter soli]|uniref:Gfo/Idh/MocA family protein n=1 Tax=Solirubrobacter soli TaxID=363832 RepID=UPI00041DEC57|nr:Gfo/Idh/MocA family oxidoreductase [Solirubrobacter soli]